MKAHPLTMLFLMTGILLPVIFSCSDLKQKTPAMPRTRIFTNDYLNPQRNPQTEESLKEKINEAGLFMHWDYLKKYLKSEVLIETKIEDESAIPVGKSRIGGLPDLPGNVEWFTDDTGKPLSFIAQFNMSDLQPYDKSGMLPASGILYFFYTSMQEAWGDDIHDRDMFRVYYYDGPEKDLDRRAPPSGMDAAFIYDACGLTFKASVCLPYLEKYYLMQKMTKEELKRYSEAVRNEMYAQSIKLLGYADGLEEMEVRCELIAQGKSAYHIPEGDDPAELAKQADGWTLLFQADSDERESGMMWGDGGRLYFWIKTEDLENKRFDRCWMILQSA
mgnify:CR=1 FL=1